MNINQRLIELEAQAEALLEMQAEIENELDVILFQNEALMTALHMTNDVQFQASINAQNDALYSVFVSLSGQHEALSNALELLGVEYDALLFVSELATPA